MAVVAVAILLLFGGAFAAINITATVGNGPPSVGQIQLCDGTCGFGKNIDPATQFTIKVIVNDPNGTSDINSFRLEWYHGGLSDWDRQILQNVTTGSRDGCFQSENIFCLQMEASDWTTKFISGAADVYIDVNDTQGLGDSNEAVALFTVNQTVGTTQDTTSGTYSGNPGSLDNAFESVQTGFNSILITHNGNVDINVTALQTDLNYLTNIIYDNNVSWNTDNNSAASTSFTGIADIVNSNFDRGTYPVSADFNLWMWADFPPDIPSGEYSGTLTLGSVAS